MSKFQKEQFLSERLEMERVLASISSKFVEAIDFDKKINYALKKIGKFVDANRSYLFLFNEKSNTFTNTHEWCAQGIGSQISNLQELSMEDYSWSIKYIKKGKVINYANIDDIPPEASFEKELFKKQEIQSILYLPVYQGEKVVGFVGFDDTLSNRKWSDSDIHLLRISSDIMGNSLKQHQIEIKLRKSQKKLKKINKELEEKYKKRTRALRDSEEKFRTLTEQQSLVGIAILQNNKFKYVNEEFAAILGYERSKLEKWTLEDILSIFYSERKCFIREQALLKQKNSDAETTHYFARASTETKKDLWLEIYSKSIQYEGAKADFISVLDRTAEKKAQEKLKESERDKSIILRSISELIAFQDLDHEIIWCNQAAADSVGKTKEDLKGKKCHQVWNNSSEVCESCPVERATKSKTPCLDEQETYDGRYWELKGYPVKNEEGKLIGAVEVGKDVTELRKIQENFQQSYYHTQLYKDLFAHDINNILQNINSAVELSLMRGKNSQDPSSNMEFLNLIKEQVIRGNKLVSNVQKLTDLEISNDRKLERVDVKEVLASAIHYIEKSFKQKKLSIKKTLDRQKLIVKANDLLQDVFENILINAIRHNDQEIIKIHVKADILTKDKNDYVRIEFLDNGIGIKDKFKREIFQKRKFEQKSGTGMGLGLSLVKKIINNYKGKIAVRNRIAEDYQKGSNFILLIPEYINET